MLKKNPITSMWVCSTGIGCKQFYEFGSGKSFGPPAWGIWRLIEMGRLVLRKWKETVHEAYPSTLGFCCYLSFVLSFFNNKVKRVYLDFPHSSNFQEPPAGNWFIGSLGWKTKQTPNRRDHIGSGPFGGYLLRHENQEWGQSTAEHSGTNTTELGVRKWSFLWPYQWTCSLSTSLSYSFLVIQDESKAKHHFFTKFS